MSNINKNKLNSMLGLYKIFKKLNPKERVLLLDMMNEDATDYICEGVHNFLSSLTLPKKRRDILKKKLNTKKDVLRYLSNRTNDVQARKESLKQEGGSIGIILASIIPLLAKLAK